MRILHLITRSVVGGAPTVVSTLASSAAAAGDDVVISAGPEGGGTAWVGLPPEISLITIKDLVREVRPARDLAALPAIARLYRDFQPDVVHLHTSKAGALGRLVPGIDRGRIVYTMHGYQQLTHANPRTVIVDRALRRRTGAIVAVSEADLRRMNSDGYRATLIRNGTVDPLEQPMPPEPVVAQLRRVRSRGLPVVMMVARDQAPKRVGLARLVAHRLIGVAEFVWIGGPKSVGDPQNFTAIQCSQGAACLRFADVSLLLSDHEGLPTSVVEGMSVGVPSVVSAVAGCLEVLGLANGRAHGPAGIAVPNDGDAVVAAIARLAADPAFRRTQGNAARRRWEACFSAQRMVKEYGELYRSLAHPRVVGRSPGHVWKRGQAAGAASPRPSHAKAVRGVGDVLRLGARNGLHMGQSNVGAGGPGGSQTG